MTLERNNSEFFSGLLPQSQQAADRIRAEITAGRLRPGDRLESIRILAERFGVGRQVMLSAFDKLSDEGLLIKEVGRGTFINPAYGTKPRVAFYVHDSSISWFFTRNVFLGCAEMAETLDVELTLAPASCAANPAAWCRANHVHALLVTGDVTSDLAGLLIREQLPYLILGSYELPPEASMLPGDNRASAEALVRMFQREPARHPGAVLGLARYYSTRKFCELLTTTAAQYGATVSDAHLIHTETEDGYASMEMLSRLDERPDLLYITGRAFPGAARWLLEHPDYRPRILAGLSDSARALYADLVEEILPFDAAELGRKGLRILMEQISRT